MRVEASEEAGGAASRSRRRGQSRRGGAAVFRAGPLGRGRDQGRSPGHLALFSEGGVRCKFGILASLSWGVEESCLPTASALPLQRNFC